MTRQEIIQLKIIALQQSGGDLLKGRATYEWLRNKTDDDGKDDEVILEEGDGFA